MKGIARTLPQKERKRKRRSQDPPLKERSKGVGAVSPPRKKESKREEGWDAGLSLKDNKKETKKGIRGRASPPP